MFSDEMHAADITELMDDPACPRDQLAGNLRDLAAMNALFGGHGFIRRFLDAALPAWRRSGAGRVFTVLDVATGGGEVTAAVSRWARGRGIRARVVGVDRHPTIAGIAARARRGDAAVAVVRADACALPFRPRSVDVCLCSLALHHLPPGARAAFLARLDALARVGFLVVDLLRCPGGYATVWLVTRAFRNTLTRHDGPVSVRRAMSWREYRRCLVEARVPGLELERLPFFRVALRKVAAG